MEQDRDEPQMIDKLSSTSSLLKTKKQSDLATRQMPPGTASEGH
jgi:hypothetical protein